MISGGSEWHRWAPHIHAPGTLMNDQFNGPMAWEDYLSALEAAMPVIEAMAVTDYYVADTYERVRAYLADDRLPSVRLVFPNVELRLHVSTAKGGFVNAHLFVSPEDPAHIEISIRGRRISSPAGAPTLWPRRRHRQRRRRWSRRWPGTRRGRGTELSAPARTRRAVRRSRC